MIADCNNKDIMCGEMSLNGECTRNPHWMKVNCRLACNLCAQADSIDEGKAC